MCILKLSVVSPEPSEPRFLPVLRSHSRNDNVDVMNLIESDEEDVFHDAVPRLPPVTNGRASAPETTLVEIHRIQSTECKITGLANMFHFTALRASKNNVVPEVIIRGHTWSRRDVRQACLLQNGEQKH